MSRVVAGMVDPDPRVFGMGLQYLRNNGIQVEVGINEEACKELNAPFIYRVLTQRPYSIFLSSASPTASYTTDSHIDLKCLLQIQAQSAPEVDTLLLIVQSLSTEDVISFLSIPEHIRLVIIDLSPLSSTCTLQEDDCTIDIHEEVKGDSISDSIVKFEGLFEGNDGLSDELVALVSLHIFISVLRLFAYDIIEICMYIAIDPSLVYYFYVTLCIQSLEFKARNRSVHITRFTHSTSTPATPKPSPTAATPTLIGLIKLTLSQLAAHLGSNAVLIHDLRVTYAHDTSTGASTASTTGTGSSSVDKHSTLIDIPSTTAPTPTPVPLLSLDDLVLLSGQGFIQKLLTIGHNSEGDDEGEDVHILTHIDKIINPYINAHYIHLHKNKTTPTVDTTDTNTSVYNKLNTSRLTKYILYNDTENKAEISGKYAENKTKLNNNKIIYSYKLWSYRISS